MTFTKENPYVIGRPIHEPELFFGREELFQFIADNLAQRAKVILLHGQRRIGKSSVLYQIPNFVRLPEFVFVSLSLEGQANKPLAEVLHVLAGEILEELEANLEASGLTLPPIALPDKATFHHRHHVFAEVFLPQVYRALGGRKLVLLLDEFDVLHTNSPQTAVEQFFPYLHEVVDRHPALFIIPVVGRRLNDLPNLLNLFREAPYQEVGLLKPDNARRLITEPAKGILHYHPEALAAILELAAGHPYFTQVLCFAVFTHAREQQRWEVQQADVEAVIERAIEIGEGGLAWFRDGLPIPERVVFSAVAESQQRRLENPNATIDILTLLQSHGVQLTDTLYHAGLHLLKWNFIREPMQSPPEHPHHLYEVTIELVRRWLVKRYDLRHEVWELEKLDPQAQRLYEAASQLHQAGDQAAAIAAYEQALSHNPNHFSSLFELAAIYGETHQLDRAKALYPRLLLVDPVRTGMLFPCPLSLSVVPHPAIPALEERARAYQAKLEQEQRKPHPNRLLIQHWQEGMAAFHRKIQQLRER
ncbi:nSTAND1 domain-containing NTPase [Trichothermofontia sp.]